VPWEVQDKLPIRLDALSSDEFEVDITDLEPPESAVFFYVKIDLADGSTIISPKVPKDEVADKVNALWTINDPWIPRGIEN